VPATAAIPEHAALLRDFANTIDVDTGEETFSSRSALLGWLGERDLVTTEGRRQRRDEPEPAVPLELVRELRSALRAAMFAHHDEAAAENAPTVAADGSAGGLDAVASRFPLRLALSGDRPRLLPAQGGLAGAVAHILIAVNDAVADGSWTRLKICPASTCQWAFYDQSKNRSRTWCDMQVCGNRHKTRTYRARQRGDRRG
jgi:predicted RNA-binding Zn ribbon-like protein